MPRLIYIAHDAIGGCQKGPMLEDPRIVLARNIRRLLGGRKQIELADKAGLKGPYLSQILKARAWVSGPVLKAIAEALNVDYKALLDSSGSKELPVPFPAPKVKKRAPTLREALAVVNSYQGKLVIKRGKPKPLADAG